MPRVSLPYGTIDLVAEIPGEVEWLLPNSAEPSAPERDIARAALEEAAGTPPLREVARGRRDAVILISCRTRRTGSPVFVPEVVRILNEAGIPDGRIRVITATGTHDNFRRQDAALLLGDDLASRVRLAGHDCRTPGTLGDVGRTSRGTRVLLSREYLDADLKIACGRVTHHYFAGFTAGRKTILPGVSAFDSTEHNHGMAVLLDGGVRVNPETVNGNLATNPIHLDMLEAARLAPPDFTVCSVLNARKRITHLFAGGMEESHLGAVQVVGRADAPAAARLADLVVLSSGGTPSDVNTIQAMKALFNTFHVVRPGGAIVLCAECPEGSPEWLLKATEIPGLDELKERIARRELRKGHNALWVSQIRRRATVFMVTALPSRDVERLGFRAAPDLQSAVREAEKVAGKSALTYAIPFGNITVPNGRSAEPDA